MLQAKENREAMNMFLQRPDVNRIIHRWAYAYHRRHNLPEGDLVTAGMLGAQKAVEEYSKPKGSPVTFLAHKIRGEMRKQIDREKPAVSTVSIETLVKGESNLRLKDLLANPSASVDGTHMDLEIVLRKLKSDLDRRVFLALQEGMGVEKIARKCQCDSQRIEKVKSLCLYFFGNESKISSSEARARLCRRKGLLVEDDGKFAVSLIRNFEAINVDVTWKMYADTAAFLLADPTTMKNYDFVIIDIVLPRYEGGKPTKVAGEDLLNVIQSNPEVPSGIVLSSALSLYENPLNYTPSQVFAYLTALLERGFRVLPKKPTLVGGEWDYDFATLCKLLGRILQPESRGRSVRARTGVLSISEEAVFWMPKRKGVVTNRLCKVIGTKKIEIATTRRQRDVLIKFYNIDACVKSTPRQLC